ncbi:MAG: hypothetical protein JW953_11965 [Anaerolineae bacterium]|nr:hypothetical protein [Anaerolineae bacterium]
MLDINQRYQAFRVPLALDVPPDLTIEVGSFTPSLTGCNILDDEYYGKPGYMYHTGISEKLGGNWQFDVTGLDAAQCKVRVNANLSGLPFIPGRVIDFFIQYMLTKQGYSFIHASAISLGNKAAIYSGRGGGGKTTIALEAVDQKGFNYLGDNFVICKDGQVSSFFSPLNMFGYNLRPSVWRTLSKTKKLRFKVWNLVYRFSGGYVKVFTPISSVKVFPNALQASADIAEFNSLLSGQEFFYQPVDRAKIVKRTVSNQKLEFFPFVRHTALYGCLFPESDFARHWEIYEALLYRNLPVNIPYRQITMPEKITSNVLKCVLDLYGTKDETINTGNVIA